MLWTNCHLARLQARSTSFPTFFSPRVVVISIYIYFFFNITTASVRVPGPPWRPTQRAEPGGWRRNHHLVTKARHYACLYDTWPPTPLCITGLSYIYIEREKEYNIIYRQDIMLHIVCCCVMFFLLWGKVGGRGEREKRKGGVKTCIDRVVAIFLFLVFAHYPEWYFVWCPRSCTKRETKEEATHTNLFIYHF